MTRRELLAKLGVTAAMLAVPEVVVATMPNENVSEKVHDVLVAVMELKYMLDMKGIPQEGRWLFVSRETGALLREWNPSFGKEDGLIGAAGLFKVFCWKEINTPIMYAGHDDSDTIVYLEWVHDNTRVSCLSDEMRALGVWDEA